MLRADAQLPAAVKDVLDYEEGRTLIDEAAKTDDLVLRDELLRDASEKLEGFAKTNPQLRQGARPRYISASCCSTAGIRPCS